MPIPGFQPFTSNPWEKHWTFFPRRINGKIYWCEYVYRKFVLSPGGGFYKYGDDFDVLRDM